MAKMNDQSEYQSKIGELSTQLRAAKDQLRKLQFEHREDEKLMKTQHESLVSMEDRCRKMRLLIKDKRNGKSTSNLPKGGRSNSRANSRQKPTNPDDMNYTQEDLAKLQEQLKQAETEKLAEEKKLKLQVLLHENKVQELQGELNGLNLQVKQRDHEYRLNEMKIKELRRQLPSKVLKPLDQKFQQQQPSKSQHTTTKSVNAPKLGPLKTQDKAPQNKKTENRTGSSHSSAKQNQQQVKEGGTDKKSREQRLMDVEMVDDDDGIEDIDQFASQ